MSVPILNYLDFDLLLSRADNNTYSGEVRASPVGPSPRVPLNWPFCTQPVDMLMLKIENAILKGRGVRGFRGAPISAEERVLREFGTDVFTAVFRKSPEIAANFTASLAIVRARPDCGLRLVLHLEPPELAMLPWEYMFDQAAQTEDGKFVCLHDISALVRFLEVRAPLSPIRGGSPLRILGMIANPATEGWDPLNTEAERMRIEQAVASAGGAVSLKWVPGGTRDDLFDQLQSESWDIFHFVGHGGTQRYQDPDGKTHTQGYVVLQRPGGGADPVYASELGMALNLNATLKLAVLNCCESARSGNGFLSVGAAVVDNGVPLAVAMQFSITDGAAARFAGQFYKSLIAGQTVEQAITIARKFVAFQSNLEWGIPVLYSRTGASILFDVRPGPPYQPPPSPVISQAAESRTQARQELRRLFS